MIDTVWCVLHYCWKEDEDADRLYLNLVAVYTSLEAAKACAERIMQLTCDKLNIPNQAVWRELKVEGRSVYTLWKGGMGFAMDVKPYEVKS